MKALEIIEAVEDYTEISLADMKSKSRKQEIVYARYFAMLLLREYTTMSLDAIGKIFTRDHSTVIHGMAEIRNLMFMDKKKRDLYALMEKRLKKMEPTPVASTIPIYDINHVFKTA